MRGFRRFLFTEWNSKLLLSLFMAVTMSGCVSIVQPVGDWARPSDLGLNEKSLAGLWVAVRTARLKKGGEVSEQALKVHTLLENALRKLGAEVVNADSELDPDLTLWYIEHGEEDSQTSYLSEAAFFFSGGIVPLISSRELGGELRVTDGRGVLLSEQSAKIVDVQAFGWLALIHVFNFSESSRSRRQKMSQSFLRSAQNLVYSQALRARVARAGKGDR